MELIAEGPEPRQRWRITLEPGATYLLGREHDGMLVVPWDNRISRRHAHLTVRKGRLHVRRDPSAVNPLFFAGKEVEECELRPGEHFVLGVTCFYFADEQSHLASPAADPVGEVTFSRQALQKVRFRDADKRIEVLAHLPEVIYGARTESETFLRIVNLLLAGITQAEAAAIVQLEGEDELRVLHWDRRRETAGELRPSARLIREAIRRRGQTVLHVWESGPPKSLEFTATVDFDWAFCTPVPGSATEGWGLYLAGRRHRPFGFDGSMPLTETELEGDVKFAELVAEIVSAVWRLRQLERQQAGLRQFFAPAVLAAVGEKGLDTGLLAPREADVTILFCDLRGFSLRAETARDDLLGLLDRVSQAMGVMTQHILAHGGGIGDFLGDAAMGFWGWPVASPDAPLEACRAALAIRAEFEQTVKQKNHPLSDFQVGIGIAHGRAVAGKIGTSDHVKVTVFGPVVNLASRLESMTKQLRVPILIDERVAAIVRERLPPAEGRIRRLARVLPFGMETPVMVSELLPCVDDCPELTDAHLEAYESAVEHFLAGRWEDAHRALHTLPASDRAQDFLAVLIAQHNRVPPPGWDGVVRLPSK